LVTDARYDEQATQELAGSGVAAAVVITREDGEAVATALGHQPRIGLEADHLSWSQTLQIDESWLSDSELVPTVGLVANLRRNKDAGEIARIEEAARITDDAVATVLALLAAGASERDVALELDTTLRRLGASGPAFETIVAAGPNGSLPHARPSDRLVEPTDLVIIDVGSIVDGYHSDMTRSWSVGEADGFQQGIWSTVAAAQAAGVDTVAAGVAASAVDVACRTVITEAGWGKHFIHGTGHGVGLEIHEEPWIGAKTDAPLEVGDVITVEPGIYVPGRAGVRIEDTVVVTETGCRALTLTPKTLGLP
jgi:Xaa-Pro aminopeptidase